MSYTATHHYVAMMHVFMRKLLSCSAGHC